MGKRIPVQVRFFAKIADAGDCWVWTAELDRDGYGHFRDEHGRRVRAHRWAFEFFMALIPSGLVIDHLCRNRACVNPWHMEPVTNEVNILRSEAPSAINARRVCCLNDHPLDESNTYITPDGRRNCKKCQRARTRAHRARKRAADAA